LDKDGFSIFDMTNADYIKQQIPILEVAQRLGIQIINKQAFCFNGHDRKTPSLTFYSKTNSFHGFGCSAGSTNIDLVMQAEYLDFEEAV
jgi:DNA primase